MGQSGTASLPPLLPAMAWTFIALLIAVSPTLLSVSRSPSDVVTSDVPLPLGASDDLTMSLARSNIDFHATVPTLEDLTRCGAQPWSSRPRQVDRIHILSGMVASGKSSLAERLQRDYNAVIYSADEWVRRIHGKAYPVARFAEVYYSSYYNYIVYGHVLLYYINSIQTCVIYIYTIFAF